MFEPKIEPTFPYPKAEPPYSYPRDALTYPYGDAGFPFVGDSKGKMGEGGSLRPIKPDFDWKPHKTRGKRDDKKVRPTSLQKICKKIDGIGDPYDHIALYRQLIFAEGVFDMHTMVQGFGLTMEGGALAWFQTLKPSTLYDFENLVKRFIEAYSKIGIKHNTITQILSFK